MPEPEIKKCRLCHNSHPSTTEFWYRNKHRVDNLSLYCKTCQNYFNKKTRRNRKLARFQNKAQITGIAPLLPPPSGYKRCSKCKMSLPATGDYFTKDTSRSQNCSSWCKKCRRKYERVRYQNLGCFSHEDIDSRTAQIIADMPF